MANNRKVLIGCPSSSSYTHISALTKKNLVQISLCVCFGYQVLLIYPLLVRDPHIVRYKATLVCTRSSYLVKCHFGVFCLVFDLTNQNRVSIQFLVSIYYDWSASNFLSFACIGMFAYPIV